MDGELRRLLAGKKYHIYKYGCWMNDRDAETAAGILDGLGCEYAERDDEAEIAVFNTCSVCEAIEVAAYSRIRHARQEGLLIVCGCMPQLDPAKVAEGLPGAQIIFGTGQMHRLPEFLYRLITRGERVVCTDAPAAPREDLPVRRGSAVCAYVGIMNGCANRCSYCVVPAVRGGAVCRPPAKIIREVELLIGQGYREVTLLGQNSLDYSADGMDFAGLLQSVAATGVERVRFLTSNPRDMTERILRLMAETPNICRSLHLPAQAGSNQVLAAMNRGYTRERYVEIAELFYELMPHGALTTDLIVGFPGESEADYQETEELYRRLRFADAYLFAYSPRPGTTAERMPGQVSESVKYQRLRRLARVKEEIRARRAEEMCGVVQRILVEEQRGGYALGRTNSGWFVAFSATAPVAGQFVEVMVTAAKDMRLSGTML